MLRAVLFVGSLCINWFHFNWLSSKYRYLAECPFLLVPFHPFLSSFFKASEFTAKFRASSLGGKERYVSRRLPLYLDAEDIFQSLAKLNLCSPIVSHWAHCQKTGDYNTWFNLWHKGRCKWQMIKNRFFSLLQQKAVAINDRDFVLSSVLTYFVNRCYTNSDTIKRKELYKLFCSEEEKLDVSRIQTRRIWQTI